MHSRLVGRWDDILYRSMLGVDRPAIAAEEAELAGYRALHGACSCFTLGEMKSMNRARFVLTCHRGTLEIDITRGPDDRVQGFTGTSRGHRAGAAATEAATRLATLITAWDTRVYTKHFSKPAPDKATAEQAFARIHGEHGGAR